MASTFKRNRAVVIGINQYGQGIPPLGTAANDARAIAHLLKKNHQYEVAVYLDEAATLEKFTALLQNLNHNIGTDDRFLFYFAGHGIALNGDDGPQGYLIPQDAKLGDVSSYLPMVDVEAALTGLSCRHCLVVLDCCFGGAFRWSSTRKLVPIEKVIHKERYDRFIQDPAWQVITSAAHDQHALDALDLKDDRGVASNTGKHSPFAVALMEALMGKADVYPPAQKGQPPGDGVITATELYSYLRDRVEIATEERRQRQTPGIWPLKKHDKGEYIFLAPGHPLNLPPAPPLDVSSNPYRGLESFDEAHSDLFFGRAELVEALQAFVEGRSLTIVLGASGSGKSSVVKAGLMPKLRHDEDAQWLVLPPVRPGESPFQSLNSALSNQNLPAVKRGDAQQTLAQSIRAGVKANPNTKLLLFIDQCEELITLCDDEDERKEFFQQVLLAIRDHREAFRVVLSLRSDFEPQVRDTGLQCVPENYDVKDSKILQERWQNGRFIVSQMSRGELRQVIERPAEARVMYFQSDDPQKPLVDQLIDEVADMPGALPLLSFSLSELYLKYLRRQDAAKKRGETIDRAITEADYRELGGVTLSLTKRADQEYDALVEKDPAYAQTIRHVMLRMVAVTGGEIARRRVPLSELAYPPKQNERVQTVIQRFTEARLLIPATDTEGKPYVEPAHDALVRGWQRLLTWKRDEEENLLLQRRLTPAAEEWQHQQKPRFLWNANPRLDLLQKVLTSKNSWLNQVETEFVQKSVGRRTFNIRRNWAVAIAVMVGLGTGLIFSLIGQRDALIEQIRATRQSSEANFLANQELDALIESLKAGKSLQNWPRYLSFFEVDERLQGEVASSLLKMVYGVKETERWAIPDGVVWDIFFTDEGELLTLTTHDNMIRIIDKYGNLHAEIDGQIYRDGSSVSPDGSQVAIATQDGRVQIWDWRANSVNEFQAYQGASETEYLSVINSIVFSPDGERLVTAGIDATENTPVESTWQGDKIIRFWDLNGVRQAEVDVEGLGFWGGFGFDVDGDVIIAHIMQDDPTDFTSYSIQIEDLNRQARVAPIEIGTTAVEFAFDPNGRKIGVNYGEESDNLLVVDLDEPDEPQTIEARTNALIFDDRSHFFYAGVDGTVYYSTGSGTPDSEVFELPRGRVEAFLFTPDAEQLITVGDDKSIRFWNLESQALSRYQLAQQNVRSVAFMPDGSKIVADSVGTINVLDSNGQFVRELHQLSNVVGLDFNANTQAIAALDEGGRLYILDLQGRVVREFQAHEENAQDVNWSQDGQSLVTVGDRGQRVRLWNVEGEQIEEVQISDPVFTWEDAGFDATGKPIMISRGIENQNVGNIDLSDFSEQGSTNIIPGRQMGNFLRQVKLGHPANVLVTTAGSNSVSLWDLRGQQLVEFPVGIPSIQQLSIGPNNQKVAAIAEDGNTEVLELGGLSDLLRQGCQRIQNYLKHGPDVVEGDRTLCDDILSIAPSETPATPDSAPPDSATPDPASPPETPVQSSSSLSASVPSIDFGESPVNIPQTAWVTFTNTSDTPLLISDLALADGATPSFTILGQGCSPAELQPEQPCAVEVQFLPEEAGIYESQLVVTSSGETVAMIPLSGVGQ